MSYQVVIAEKKSLADDIVNALRLKGRAEQGYFDGGQVKVTWASGHLLQQVEPQDYDPKFAQWSVETLPIIPSPFQMKVKVDPRTRKTDSNAYRQIKVINGLLHGAATVVNAGDPDREGQLIVDELLRYLKCRLPARRLWLHAQTNDGINSAWKQMKDNRDWQPLSAAAQCRSELDWLIGMNGTRGYTKLWQQKGNVGVLNVGRVKAPTVHIVVERELEIRNFKPKDYYLVKVGWRHPKGLLATKWLPAKVEAPHFDEDGRLVDWALANKVMSDVMGKPGVVATVESEPKRNAPPLLLSLGELQKEANRFGLSPDQTLACAQKLYATYKLTTYPRTTCRYAPEEMHANAGRVLAAVRANMGDGWALGSASYDTTLKSGAWNNGKLEEHYAIMPTAENVSAQTLSPDERIVYELVVKFFCAQFLPAYEYISTTVIVESAGHQFQAQGRVPTKLGWREIFGGAPAEKDDDGEDLAAMPKVSAGDKVTFDSAVVDAKKTTPPPRYTGSSLIDAMENAHRYVIDPRVKSTLKNVEGIGTPATRSEIVASLVREDFFRVEKARVGKGTVYVPTDKAFAYDKAIPADLRLVDFTAWFEGRLEDVAKGTLAPENFRASSERFVRKIVTEMQNGSVLALMPQSLVTEKPAPRAQGQGSGRSATPGKGSRAGATTRRTPARPSTRPRA